MPGIGALPSTENLQCFLAAAENLHFRRAAASVALTPTAFGQRIRQLEDQLGTPLFERTTRHVRLTTAGLALLPVARRALAEAQDCFQAVHAEAPVSFVLGTRFELGLSWLVPAIAALEEERPTWTIHLYFGSGSDILGRLEAGDVDAIVTSAPVARARWHADVLHPETYALVAAPALLAREPLATDSDAAHHVLLDVDRTVPLGRYLTSAPGVSLAFRDVRYLGTGGAIHQLALAGRGVAVLPEYMIAPDLEAGRLVRLLPHHALLTDTFRLMYDASAPHAKTFAAFADHLRTVPLR